MRYKKILISDRIGLFLATPWGDGAERVMVTLAGSMAERGYEVDLVLYQAESYAGAVPDGVRAINLNASGAMASIPGLTRYIRKARPRVMLSTVEQANIALLLAKQLSRSPVRIVVREANTTSLTLNATYGIKGTLHRRLMPVCYPWADAIVAVSEGVADDLSSTLHLPRERVNVVYNPVALARIRAKAAVAVEHPWFAPGQPPVIVSSGRLSPQKDFPTLLRAFAQLRRHREAHLVIFGEGSDREKLKSLAIDLGIQEDVLMPGHIDNPHSYVARSALFVLSSIFEGLPNALIEALAVGTPVVSTDCESGPREILQGGCYGKLVPVGDIDALYRAMLESLDDPESRQVSAEAIDRFDLDRAVDTYLQILLGSES